VECFKLPVEDFKDEPPRRPHFLEKTRAARELWLKNNAARNDAIKQRQAKGESNEAIIRQMLEKYLPPQYGIVEGFLIDSKGVQSKQTDVIIYDQFTHPHIIFDDRDKSAKTNRFIPIDSAVATIEVKTTLKGKLWEAFDNIQSTRTNLEPTNPLVIPAEWGIHYYTGYPTSLIFAFRSGWSKPDHIKKAVRTELIRSNINPKSYFDLIYVHDKDVTLSWVYGYENDTFLVRPCDHWDKPLHLTEITPDSQSGKEGLGLSYFLSWVITFVTRFQLPRLNSLLYYYGPPVKMKFNTDDEPIHPTADES
jgi:hypothetical protein